ncbi:MAG TPA: amidohydrolase family protein [Ktedonobacteraceae bacterium]|nr:amidohydrolase family protein [Ktedonobacteraceae bacterium]
MTPIDLSNVPLADNHCHGIYRTQTPVDITAWRGLFTESSDLGMRSKHVTTALFYRRLVREMATFFDCEPTEEAVLTARQQLDEQELIHTFLRAANFDVLFIDKGYPPQDLLLSDATVSDLANCQVAPILRVELLMQRLISENTTLSAVVEALRAALNDVRGQGYVALKSIVAYRTGLDIRTWMIDDVEEAFAAARYEVQEKGSIRLAHKPLLDTLLHVTFEEAALQELPVQFHTGYGDADADMLLANPLHLRAVLERREYRAMPIVLLHESYPYTQQGAYLATIYENVYLDLSYGIPFLGYHEMLEFTRAAFSVAPYSKLLYSSDAVGVPELHWISALDGRRILGQVLSECLANGDLSQAEAEQAGVAVLHDNAMQLYKC